MNSKTGARIIALTVFAALAIPVSLAAQNSAEDQPHQYHHYRLIDPGTFGGPQSFLSQIGGLPRAGILNNRGTLTGAADTLTVNPYCLGSQDCYAAHAFQMKNGVTTDLGVLAGGISGSQVNWISPSGLMTGLSDNGQQDPLTGGPEIHGVLWKHGGMTDLGTLPQGGYLSFPFAVNNRGEVVGLAQNTVPDANAMLTGYGYQTRAFYWKNGVMQDLGTLGTGTDAVATLINERGQVIGVSYTSSVPSASCAGAGFPLTTGSFIWDKENGMKDIGGFGGTCTLSFDLNEHGQVVGQSDLADQTSHPFVWDSETGMTDLGTPDGGGGSAEAINEHGDVVGIGETKGGPQHAMLWRKRGGKWKITDLGTPNGRGCSYAFSINASGQVVGNSGIDNCQGVAFLWEDGGHMVDLNTLVPPNSGLQLFEPQQINDRGEIAVEGTDANGNQHAVLLIPCDEGHPGVEGCDYSIVDAATAAQSAVPRSVLSGTQRLEDRPNAEHGGRRARAKIEESLSHSRGGRISRSARTLASTSSVSCQQGCFCEDQSMTLQQHSSAEWLDLKELQQYACVSERTIRAWIHRPVNPLPAVQVGKKILVRKSIFDSWLEAHQVKPFDIGGIVEDLIAGVTR